jgi:hypothetical protein
LERDVSRCDSSARGDPRSAGEHVVVGDIAHALAVGEQDDGKVLYLGPDRANHLLEVVSVVRDGGSQIADTGLPMRAKYEPLLRGEREA